MRLVGSVGDELQARRFVDYLIEVGVESLLDREGVGPWQIWVYDERELTRATTELSAFLHAPDAPAYRAKGRLPAQTSSHREEPAELPWQVPSGTGVGLLGHHPLTYLLMALSIAVALASNLGSDHNSILRYLYIVDFDVDGKHILFQRGFLYDVRHGQVWRLLTPIFLHFGLPHLIFNLMWMFDLAGQIEEYRGTTRLSLLVLLCAIPSNVAQLVISGPQFGGLSGVVYGLFGYIWLRTRYDPATSLSLRPSTVVWMLAWFGICLTGILPVANTVHSVGLGIGCLVGARHEIRRRLITRA